MLPVFEYPPSELQRDQDLRPVYSYLYRLAEELNNQLLTTKNEAVEDTIGRISETDLIQAVQQTQGNRVDVAEITRRVQAMILALSDEVARDYATKTELASLGEDVEDTYATKDELASLGEDVADTYATSQDLDQVKQDVLALQSDLTDLDTDVSNKVSYNELFSLVHPIGSYMLYGPGADPNGILPGEWQLAEDTTNWSIWERITPATPVNPGT